MFTFIDVAHIYASCIFASKQHREIQFELLFIRKERHQGIVYFESEKKDFWKLKTENQTLNSKQCRLYVLDNAETHSDFLLAETRQTVQNSFILPNPG